MDTPVVFIVFNRPDTTARVFEEIRRARPERLLVVADGPRADRAGEAEKCAVARAVVERVDWPCAVERNYSETNLGCKRRVISGLNWVFERCDEAIILEDDCVPHPSFFRYCAELLERYRDDDRIMLISGCNFVSDRFPVCDGYYFSYYPCVWGWACWRRAWTQYEGELQQWDGVRDVQWLKDHLRDGSQDYWLDLLNRTKAGQIDTWDLQWFHTVWRHGGYAVIPNRNLVQNIGWGPGATHTGAEGCFLGRMPVSEMIFPLKHAQTICRDSKKDQLHYYRAFREMEEGSQRFHERIVRRVKGLVRRIAGR